MTITNNDAKEEQKRILKLIDQRIDRADTDWRSKGRNLIDRARLKELEGLKIDISLAKENQCLNIPK